MADGALLHGVVVLAAGASGRLGRAKQLVAHRGETLVRRATRLALETEPGFAALVLGADADAVFASVADLPVRRIDCAAWRAGLSASLAAGIAALPDAIDAALIVVCDQPALDTDHLQRLCAAWRAQPDRAVASAYAGTLGVPAVLPRAWFEELRQHSGDRGARDLLAQRGTQVIAIENQELALDVDYAGDLPVIDS